METVLLFLIAVAAVIAAFVSIIVALDKESIIGVGAAVLLAIIAFFGFWHGAHRVNVRFHNKHEQVYRDLTKQGFTIASNNIYAIGGNDLTGTEADFVVGACVYPFHLTKLDGVWRVTLLRADGNGRVVLHPDDIAKLTCPAG